jgi:hypothetical protein
MSMSTDNPPTKYQRRQVSNHELYLSTAAVVRYLTYLVNIEKHSRETRDRPRVPRVSMSGDIEFQEFLVASRLEIRMIDMEIGEPAGLVADNAMSLLKRFVVGIPRGFEYPGLCA